MKSFIVVLACLSFVYGEITSGFRVRWSPNPSTEGYFIDVPEEAKDFSSDWTKVTRADGLFADYTMYCYKNEVTFCSFYDNHGYVRGFQVAILKSAYTGGPVTLDKLGFTSWQYKNLDYWTVQQFFVKEAGQTTWDPKKLLQQDAVYFSSPSSKNYLQIGTDVDSLDKTKFSKKGCLPSMGTHYFSDNEKDCNDILPWFFLYNGNQLVGSGFWLYGDYKLNAQPNGPTVDMFEYWKTADTTKDIVANSKCIMDNFGKYKIFSMHVFYVDDYSKISCN